MINIDNLIIEVGRDCNMRCEHCLRGNAQTVAMSEKIIDSIFSDVSFIRELTITGGEPFLYSRQIHKIVDTIKKKKINVGCFFIATNGSLYSYVIMEYIIELYNLCDEKELCELRISYDKYHDTKKIDNRFYAYKFTSCNTKQRELHFIKEGRAADNGIGVESSFRTVLCEGIRNESTYTLADSSDKDYFIEGMIYVNAKGGILFDCDFSYEHQDEFEAGNIKDSTILEIAKSHLV